MSGAASYDGWRNDSHRQINTELSAEICTQCHKIDVNNAVEFRVMCALFNTEQVRCLSFYLNKHPAQIELDKLIENS